MESPSRRKVHFIIGFAVVAVIYLIVVALVRLYVI